MRKEVINALAPKKGSLIPAIHFQAVSFYNKLLERQIVVLYTLGEDGIVREFVGDDKWKEFPIVRD